MAADGPYRAVGASGIGEFLSGLILGLLLGLLLSPILRSWLAWHEWVTASRQARLTEDVLRRMAEGPTPPRSRSRPTSNRRPGDVGEGA